MTSTLKTGRMGASASGSPQESQNVGHMVWSFSCQGEAVTQVFLPDCLAWAIGRVYGEMLSHISLPAVLWLVLHSLEHRRLSPTFWISQKANCSVYS